MTIRCYIFTYDREQMLRATVSHLNTFGIEPIIYDDGSDYECDLPNYNRHKHRGKRLYWKTWDDVLLDAKKNKADLYIFMPEDFQDIDIERIKTIHDSIRKPYVFNIINDGRKEQWVRFKPQELEDRYRVGFTDCGFFCDREALDTIGWYADPINNYWFEKYGSSGVGHQLTKRFFYRNIPCYIPKKSLAYHGDHESKMHPEERKKNKLISR